MTCSEGASAAINMPDCFFSLKKRQTSRLKHTVSHCYCTRTNILDKIAKSEQKTCKNTGEKKSVYLKNEGKWWWWCILSTSLQATILLSTFINQNPFFQNNMVSSVVSNDWDLWCALHWNLPATTNVQSKHKQCLWPCDLSFYVLKRLTNSRIPLWVAGLVFSLNCARK